MSSPEVGRCVICTAVKVMYVYRVWTEKGMGRQKRPTDQPRRTTECHDKRLCNCFFETILRQIANHWFEEQNRSVTMSTLYRRIRAFGIFYTVWDYCFL